MNKKILVAWIVGSSFFSASLSAATLIEMKESDGSTVKMWVEGSKMRVDSDEGYAITDMEKRKMYYISPAEGTVMDMSSILAPQSPVAETGEQMKVDVKKMGAGPDIAGYSTQHYKVSVQGDHCKDIFLSTKAMDDMASKDIIKYMQDMSDTGIEEMEAQWSSPCDHADQGIDYVKLGFPMRTVDIENNSVEEVKSIQLNAMIPAGGFELPKGMQIIDMGQMMDMMRQMQPPQP